jgi:hypothetical protein
MIQRRCLSERRPELKHPIAATEETVAALSTGRLFALGSCLTVRGVTLIPTCIIHNILMQSLRTAEEICDIL